MPLEPILQKLIDVARERGPIDRSHLPVAEQRRAGLEDLAELFRGAGEPGPALDWVEDLSIAGPAGEIPLRLYRPASPRDLPVHVYLHGGGWWTGDLDMVDDECRHRAARVPCVVVSVDYRLAPEHPFPVPLEDCYAATIWTWQNARDLGADPARLSVGGASAGGNLAAALCLLSRARGSPPIVAQVLECPALDPALTSDSMRELGNDFMLTRNGLAVAWAYYLPREEQRRSELAAPLLAEDLSGLPPALITTAEYDPLRDEGEEYGRRLEAARSSARVIRYCGVIHGFGGLTRVLSQARACRKEITSFLRSAGGAVAPDRAGSSTKRG